MARRILAALVIALLAVGYVVVRDASRSDAKRTIVSGPSDPVVPTVMKKLPTRYHVVATPVRGRGHLFLQVGTYLQPPKDTIVLDVYDGQGLHMRHCVFPPTSYTDNGLLRCELPDISRAHALLVTRVGTAKIALYHHENEAGTLVKDEATSLPGRISTVLSRIAVPLPNGVGSVVLLTGLGGSVLLTALVLLLALPISPRRNGGEYPESGSQPTAGDSGSSGGDSGGSSD